MLRRALLAHSALVGVSLFFCPAALAASYTESTFSAGGTLAGSSADTLTVSAGATISAAGATAVTLTNTAAAGNSLTIINSGTIASGTARAIDLNNKTSITALTITNDSGGVITAADDAIRVNKALVAGSALVIDNAGTIHSDSGQALDLKSMTVSGVTTTIVNRATGVISSSSADVIRPGVGATITNSGVICAGSYSAGACTSSSSDGDGIDGQSNTGITIRNETGGLISGAKHGITGDEGVTVINAAGATIAGRNGSGVNIDNATIDSTTGAFTALAASTTVTNSGTITGAGTDGDGVDVDGVVVLENYGTIMGLSATGTNTAEAVAAGGGTIVNAAGAVLSGAHNGILIDNGSTGADYSAATTTTITNAGTISGLAGYAIKLVGSTGYAGVSLDDTITNSGLISAVGGTTVVDMGGGNDVLVNTGTITGSGATTAIQMGAGNDTITINGGAVTGGAIDGGAGTDSLTFFSGGSGGSFTFASDVVNVETITVAGGRVVLGGAVTGSTALTIDSGAALQVLGSISTGTLTVNGTLLALDSASSVRTITASGDYSQGSAGTLVIRVAGSAADTVAVSGAATLADGATLSLLTSGYIANGTTVTVLSAAGGVSADVSSLILDYTRGLISWSLVNSGTSLDLVASRASFQSLGGGAGAAAGQMLDGLATSASGDLSTVIGLLDAMDSGTAGTAIRQLAPRVSGAGTEGARVGMDKSTGMVANRLAGLREGGGPVALAAAAPGSADLAFASASDVETFQRGLGLVAASADTGLLGMALGVGETTFAARPGVWVQGFGATARQDRRGDSDGYVSRTAGIAFGADRPVGQGLLVGVNGAVSRTQVSGLGGDSDDKTRADTYLLGGYASQSFGDSFVDAALSGGWSDYTGRRSLSTLGRDAEFSSSGWQGQARTEAGHRFGLDEGWSLTPSVSLSYSHLHLDSYTETGAGSVSLRVDGQDYDTLTTGVMLRAGAPTIDVAGGRLATRLNLGWSYDAMADHQSVTSSFVGGGTAFVTTGESPARHALLAGAGATWSAGDLSVDAGYQGEVREAYVSHGVAVRLRQEF